MNALRRGTVPAAGLSRIAVGLELEEGVIARTARFCRRRRRRSQVRQGGLRGGKDLLCRPSPRNCGRKRICDRPHLHLPDSLALQAQVLYQQVCAALRTAETDHAVKTVIDNWLFAIEERLVSAAGTMDDAALGEAAEKEIESSLARISEKNAGLSAALRTYYRASNAGDYPTAQAAIGWIAGEPTVGRDFRQKAGIRGDVDDATAFLFLAGLVEIVRGAGYRGLAIAIDELEITQGLQRNQREKSYQTLARIIDALRRGPDAVLLLPLHRHSLHFSTVPAASAR